MKEFIEKWFLTRGVIVLLIYSALLALGVRSIAIPFGTDHVKSSTIMIFSISLLLTVVSAITKKANEPANEVVALFLLLLMSGLAIWG